MKLTTPVQIQPLKEGFTYSDKILFMGSCFAQNIGQLCADHKLDCLTNPMGVLFNPCSIGRALGQIEGYGMNSAECRFREEDVVETPAGFCSYSHHSKFARQTTAEFLHDANQSLSEACSFLSEAKWIVVTLGTAFVYYNSCGEPVANCHKLPATEFTRRMISVQECTEALEQYINANPERQWIFTVSPVRHLADGLHQNQLSKSTLLLAVNQLQERYENAHYFPSYEILMDELRDYRFYADDLMHPSAQAVQYVWERFMEYGLSADQQQILKQAGQLLQMENHAVMIPESRSGRDFIAKREALRQEFGKKLSALRDS